MVAYSAYPTATPDSSRRIEVTRPPLRAIRKTSSDAPSAPRKALAESAYCPKPAPAPNRIAAAAPLEAPELTPSRYGSASTFRTMACNATPHTASPAPTSMPSSTRGSRTCQTIASCGGVQLTSPGRPTRW